MLGTRHRSGARGRALTTTAIVTAALVSGAILPAPAAATDPTTTIALLGDTPYGASQRTAFPRLVKAINADPAVSLVLHAGDTKGGASPCDDATLNDRFRLFNTFTDPFVVTPGDDDWTDCHTSAAGRYLPTERLDTFRRIFYPVPGQTSGRTPRTVTMQAVAQPQHAAYRENVLFDVSGVVVATVHVVGSHNDLNPWSGLAGGDRPTKRMAEFNARRSANLAWINAAFDTAVQINAPGVLLMLQAEPVNTPAFAAERRLIVQRAQQFGKPVLLVHGDEHRYEVEGGYAGVANLTRLETYGDTASDWLRVTVDPSQSAVFSWVPRRV